MNELAERLAKIMRDTGCDFDEALKINYKKQLDFYNVVENNKKDFIRILKEI